jgi:hypothetical protein
MAMVLEEKGLMKTPPKLNPTSARDLVERLEKIYGPGLANYPTIEGKIWLAALLAKSQENQ